MKHIGLFLFLLLSLNINAQESKIDHIFINVVQPEIDNIPAEAGKQLENKLIQLVSQNGIAETDPTNRFVLSSKAMVLSKDVVPGPPQRVSLNLDFVFMVGDLVENKVYETAMISATGVGQNETKALIAAIKNVKPKNPQLIEFLGKAKQKIVDYYQLRCAQIQEEARQDATIGNYEEAIYKLMQVPEVCDCSEECQNLILAYQLQNNDATTKDLLTQARVAWAGAPNQKGAEKVVQIFEQLPINTSHQKDVDDLMSEIEKKLKSDERKLWALKIQSYKDRAEMEKRKMALIEEKQTADLAYRANQQKADIEYREKQQAADNENRAIQQAADNAYRMARKLRGDARKEHLETAIQLGVSYAKRHANIEVIKKQVKKW